MLRRLILMFSFVVLSSCGNVTGQDQLYETHSFRAIVKNVRLQAELIRQGKSNTDTVSVEVPALLFDNPLKIDDVRTVKAKHGKEIDFLIAYMKANIEGSKSDVLSYWHPDAKGGVREMLENDEIFKRNKEYMSSNPGLVVYGLVRQNDSTSVLQGKRAVLGITIKSENGKLSLIEKPANDLELAIIEASFIR